MAKVLVSKAKLSLLPAGVALLFCGLGRVVSTPTLPSYRLMEMGTVCFVLYMILTFKNRLSSNRYPPFNETSFLLLSVSSAFLYRAIWSIISPYPLGADTPTYLDLTIFVSEDPTRVIGLSKVGFEPLPLLVFAVLRIVGLPVSIIPTVVIPAVSSLSLLPIYFLTKKLKGIESAQLATFLMAVSTFQFRLILDLYRQVFAIFFMMLSLYFMLNERGMLPLRTIASATATALSHGASFFTLILVTILYVLASKSATARRNLIVCLIGLFPALMFLILVGYWGPWIAYVLGNLEFFMSRLFSPVSLAASFANKWHVVFEVVMWGMALGLAGLPSILRAKRNDFFLSFLVGVILLMVLGVFGPFGFWQEPDRWAMHMDIPLAVFAASTISRSNVKKALFALVFFWVFLDSLTFVHVYFKPWTTRTFGDWP